MSTRVAPATYILMIAALFAILESAVADNGHPSGHAIIQRFVDVCGGREAYANIRNRVIVAKVDLPDHGMEGELVEFFCPPDYRRVIVVDDYDPIVIGLTGGNPWRWISPGERSAMDDALATDTKRHGQLNPFLDWTRESGETNVTGDSTIDEDACYRVEILPVEGSPLLAFFSKKTGLLRRIDDRAANMFRYYDDYQMEGGVLIPRNVRIDAGMMGLDLDFVSIDQNIDLKDFGVGDLFQTFSQERIDAILGVTPNGSLRGSEK